MSEIRPVTVGLVGCGQISAVYLANCTTFSILDIRACADLDLARAQARADEFGIAHACTVDELLLDPEIEVILNLTIPAAHASLNRRALEAGKHVYSEKPLAIEREDARGILRLAADRSLFVGCAPDTSFGSAQQTCRRAIDEGAIGEPVAATAFMMNRGTETWHADPDFYYQPGAGPMFDMGPYYLTTLISLLGPIRRIAGATRISFPQRTITSPGRYGQVITVNTATHISGVMDFTGGPIGTIITSFDVWRSHLPEMEIYGSEGTLRVPDPNVFGGEPQLWRSDMREWRDVPPVNGIDENARGIGLADMAYAVRRGRSFRSNGEVAYHVIDCMHAFEESSSTGVYVEPLSSCEQPDPVPLGLTPRDLARPLDDDPLESRSLTS